MLQMPLSKELCMTSGSQARQVLRRQCHMVPLCEVALVKRQHPHKLQKMQMQCMLPLRMLLSRHLIRTSIPAFVDELEGVFKPTDQVFFLCI